MEDASEVEFLAGLRRLVARRGFPRILLSDNAKVFVAANKTLLDISNNTKVDRYLSDYRIQWKFIPARGAWFGGMYERMIGLTKSCLKKVLGTSLISLRDLRTILVEVECRINNRPLTYVSNDTRDPLPLSPAQLMYNYRTNILPNTVDSTELSDLEYNNSDTMRLRLSRSQNHFDMLWKKWVNEYLTALRERDNLKGKISLMKTGDIVIIHDDVPRVYWKLGMILETYPGRDNIIRSLKLKTANGIVTRPIQKCYPLEVHCDDVDLNKNLRHVGQARSLREAARKAREAIFSQLISGV